MAYQISGVLRSKTEIEYRGTSKMATRSFVIDTGGEYPQLINLQCIKDMCQVLDEIHLGKYITCNFSLRGSEWNGKVITNVFCYRIEGYEIVKGPSPGAIESTKSDQLSTSIVEPQQIETQNPVSADDGLPF